MYKLVETVEERKLFDELFKESFEEMNYEVNEYYKGERWSYLVANNDGEYVATLDFAPYRPHSGESMLICPKQYLTEAEIAENLNKNVVWELDKLSVKAEERKNKVLDNVILAISKITAEKGMKYLLADMNPVLCRALKIEYKLNVKRVGGIVRDYDYPYIKSIIPVETALMEYEEKFLQKESEVVV